MILNEETKNTFGYEPKAISKFSKKMLVVKCDCCHEIFNKESNKIYMARINSKSDVDVCKKVECIVKKRENTMEKKYGVKHALNNETIKQKRNLTCKNKETYKIASEKTKKTNLEKYGVENVFSSEWCKEKIKQTNLQKYNGVGFASEKTKEKIKKTIKEKYGVDHFQKTTEFKEKVQKTNFERYNTEWYMNSNDFREKSKKTLIKKYNVENYNQTDEFKKRLKYKKFNIMYDKIINHNRISSLYTPLFLRNEYIGVNHKYKFQCKICNNIFYDTLDDGHFPYCSYCYPPNKNISSYETEIYRFIKDELKINSVEQSNKTILENNMELDIYDSAKKIAIEINGNYWHSELGGNKSALYHVNKTKLCEQKNIHLIQIFEDEWIFFKDKIKQKIKIIFNTETNYFHARKCSIQTITKKESDAFLDTYHIQKSCISQFQFGLFDSNNTLLAVMTFGPNRFEKNSHELLRYASSTRINGGFNKLLAHYRKNYFSGKITSYADRRWTNINKNVYLSNGFKFIHTTHPNYYYINRKNYLNRIHRLTYQKHLLSKKLQYFDPNLNEWENMQLNNFDRIWDCGQLKFIIE